MSKAIQCSVLSLGLTLICALGAARGLLCGPQFQLLASSYTGTFQKEVAETETELGSLMKALRITSETNAFDSTTALDHVRILKLRLIELLDELPSKKGPNVAKVRTALTSLNARIETLLKVADAGDRLRWNGRFYVVGRSKLTNYRPGMESGRRRARRVIKIENGILRYRGKKLDTKGQEWNFVLTSDGRLICSDGDLFHTELVDDSEVAAAGTLTAVRGKIVSLGDRSGHFKPPRILMQQFLVFLKNKGIDSDKIPLAYDSTEDTAASPSVTFPAEE